MFSQPVYQLPVSKDLQRKLWRAGFQSTSDLKDVSIDDLAQEAKLQPNEAAQVLNSLATLGSISSIPKSTFTGTSDSSTMSLPSLLMFGSEVLDTLLGTMDCPGLLPGKIYEFTSVTTFGLHLIIKKLIEKYSNQTMYVDTEGDGTVLANKYYRLFTPVEMLSWIHLLPSLKEPQDQLLIIDSISFPFENGHFQRVPEFINMLRNSIGSMTVILTSHFDTKYPNHTLQSFVPIATWSHCVDVHLTFYWKNNERVISLLKGFHKPTSFLVELNETSILKKIREAHE